VRLPSARPFLTAVALLAAADQTTAGPPDPQALADRIDRRLAARRDAAGVEPAPAADDAEFLRRAYLDLTGRIPRPSDVREFLADPDPQKRARLIDDLLDSPRSASHFAAVWRAALIPETAATAEARFFQPGFEAWLRQRFRANTPYDQLVRELLTVTISADPTAPEPVLRRPADPNPLAFFAVKEAKPENLAAAATRTFLGLQLECAQCHDHPFAAWTRDQFWGQAAFFAGLERHGNGLFAPVSEAAGRREIKVAATGRAVSAAFLDDATPDWSTGKSPRAVFADWVTAKANPFFARATANRVWGQFFGVGIVDPVDDFHDENKPSHPELLDELAKGFTDAGFDLRFLVRAICRTQAYQRTSRQTHPGQADPRLFARMPVRGLTGEQFFDSLALAIGYREPAADRAGFDRGRGSPRDRFLTQFALQGKPAEPETSVPQALALMNGSFVHDATTLGTSPTLVAVRETPGMSMAERVEALFLATLSRRPTDKERDRLVTFVEEGGTGRRADRLADVLWVLLNTAEFRLNH
jgi:hypothetical protein